MTVLDAPTRSRDADPTLGTFGTDQASVVGQLNVPIYDGGYAASQTRQAKELSAQSRLILDQVRNQARTAAVGAWVSNEGAKTAVSAAEAEVRAATVALQGVTLQVECLMALRLVCTHVADQHEILRSGDRRPPACGWAAWAPTTCRRC